MNKIKSERKFIVHSKNGVLKELNHNKLVDMTTTVNLDEAKKYDTIGEAMQTAIYLTECNSYFYGVQGVWKVSSIFV